MSWVSAVQYKLDVREHTCGVLYRSSSFWVRKTHSVTCAVEYKLGVREHTWCTVQVALFLREESLLSYLAVQLQACYIREHTWCTVQVFLFLMEENWLSYLCSTVQACLERTHMVYCTGFPLSEQGKLTELSVQYSTYLVTVTVREHTCCTVQVFLFVSEKSSLSCYLCSTVESWYEKTHMVYVHVFLFLSEENSLSYLCSRSCEGPATVGELKPVGNITWVHIFILKWYAPPCSFFFSICTGNYTCNDV